MPKYSGGKKCCFVNCTNRELIKGVKTGIKFHRFPATQQDAQAFLNLNIGQFHEYTGKRVCSEHFILLNSPLSENAAKEEDNIINVNEHQSSSHDNCTNHVEYCICSLQKLKALEDKVHNLQTENNHLKQFCPINRVNDSINNMYYLNFFTNFNNLEQYNLFVDEIINHEKSFTPDKKRTWTSYKLDARIQIYIVLLRVRLGLLEHDIAFRFNVDQSTISRIFRFWVNVMFSYMIQLPIWPSRSIIKKYMPECFKCLYPSTRVILDGTEIFIEKPSDCTLQSSTYSAYKSHNTARGIVGITPNGFVSFISFLYPGRMSEKEVIIKSNILKKLEPGDSIMADRGFAIEDQLRVYDIDLIIPPFAQAGIPQFGLEDEQKTRQIASLRIHVERTIRSIKINRILHQTIPNSIADQLNQIWVICGCLTNFTKLPLLDRTPEKKD